MNFVDPTGLQPSIGCTAEHSFADCYGSGGGSFWGNNYRGNNGWGDDPNPGQGVIAKAEQQYNKTVFRYLPIDEATVLPLDFQRFSLWFGFFQQKPTFKPTSKPAQDFQALHDRVKQECMGRKRAEADRGRQQQRNNVGKRIGRSAAWGAIRGAAFGGYAGATGGFAELGWGAIPGGIAGVVVGGTLGAAGGVIVGGMAEPFYRMYYDGMKYFPALNRADIDCDAEANMAVHSASLLGGKP